MLIKGFDATSGCTSDSMRSSACIRIKRGRRPAFEPNEINFTTVFGKANGVILHARTTTYVSKHDNLDRSLRCRNRRLNPVLGSVFVLFIFASFTSLWVFVFEMFQRIILRRCREQKDSYGSRNRDGYEKENIAEGLQRDVRHVRCWFKGVWLAGACEDVALGFASGRMRRLHP